MRLRALHHQLFVTAHAPDLLPRSAKPGPAQQRQKQQAPAAASPAAAAAQAAESPAAPPAAQPAEPTAVLTVDAAPVAAAEPAATPGATSSWLPQLALPDLLARLAPSWPAECAALSGVSRLVSAEPGSAAAQQTARAGFAMAGLLVAVAAMQMASSLRGGLRARAHALHASCLCTSA